MTEARDLIGPSRRDIDRAACHEAAELVRRRVAEIKAAREAETEDEPAAGLSERMRR